jgi:hypothetical protein
MMAHIAAAVSRMKVRNPDGTERYARILYSAIEDSHELMTVPRLQAAGAIMKNIQITRFQLPREWDEFEAIVQLDNIDLIIMDPFAAHLSSGVSRHSDSIRIVTNPLTKLIEETGAAIIVVEHVLKRVGQSAHPLATIGGAGSGLPAAARMAFLFGIDPLDADRRILAPVKSNIRELPEAMSFEVDVKDKEYAGEVPFLLFEDYMPHFNALDLVTTDKKEKGKMGRPADKRALAAEWLTTYLYQAGKPVKASVVIEDAKQWAFSSKTLGRARKDMQCVVHPVGGGRNATWALPDDTIAVLNKAKGLNTNLPEKVTTEDGYEGETLISDNDLAMLLGGGDDSEPEDNSPEPY